MNHYAHSLLRIHAEAVARGERCPKCDKEQDPHDWGTYYTTITIWHCRYCDGLWYDGGTVFDTTRVQKHADPLDTARSTFRSRFGFAPHPEMSSGLRRVWHAMMCRAIGKRPHRRVPPQY